MKGDVNEQWLIVELLKGIQKGESGKQTPRYTRNWMSKIVLLMVYMKVLRNSVFVWDWVFKYLDALLTTKSYKSMIRITNSVDVT